MGGAIQTEGLARLETEVDGHFGLPSTPAARALNILAGPQIIPRCAGFSFLPRPGRHGTWLHGRNLGQFLTDGDWRRNRSAYVARGFLTNRGSRSCIYAAFWGDGTQSEDSGRNWDAPLRYDLRLESVEDRYVRVVT